MSDCLAGNARVLRRFPDKTCPPIGSTRRALAVKKRSRETRRVARESNSLTMYPTTETEAAKADTEQADAEDATGLTPKPQGDGVSASIGRSGARVNGMVSTRERSLNTVTKHVAISLACWPFPTFPAIAPILARKAGRTYGDVLRKEPKMLTGSSQNGIVAGTRGFLSLVMGTQRHRWRERT